MTELAAKVYPLNHNLNIVLWKIKWKNGICCFSCFNAQHLSVAQRIKKQQWIIRQGKIF